MGDKTMLALPMILSFMILFTPRQELYRLFRSPKGHLAVPVRQTVVSLGLGMLAILTCLRPAGTAELKAGDSEPESPPKIRDLGPPQVDDLNALRRLDTVYPVWIDRRGKQLVLMAETCRANYPLEFFATYPARGYESIVVVQVKPSIVHAGLLALGAEVGHPARFEPKFEPASGTEVAIEVRWKDQAGKPQKARAQEWVRDIRTKKALELDWVFAGGSFWTDESTGKQIYRADSAGDFISVLNLPTATLDLPIRSASALESRMFEGFVERIPPERTPVTLLLKPKLKEKGK
jgi:hypothetical protein